MMISRSPACPCISTGMAERQIDSKDLRSKRRYLMCLLWLDALFEDGLTELHSRMPACYYELAMATPSKAVPGLTVSQYRLLLSGGEVEDLPATHSKPVKAVRSPALALKSGSTGSAASIDDGACTVGALMDAALDGIVAEADESAAIIFEPEEDDGIVCEPVPDADVGIMCEPDSQHEPSNMLEADDQISNGSSSSA
eukprot:1783473-Karenia_brevis.AAC.1